jgi:hypothetical protein
MAAQQSDGAPPEQAEIYTYESDSLVYAMNWSVSVPCCCVEGGHGVAQQ